MLEARNFNGVSIFRPNQEHEAMIYDRIKSAIFGRFNPGTYTCKSDIVEIVNFKYQEYYNILEEYLPKPAPRDFVDFLVTEYERYGKVSDMHKRKELSLEDDEFWAAYASNSRRGIKYLLELLFRSELDESNVSLTREEHEEAISIAFLATEELVSLYMRSEGYKSYMDSVTLTLDPSKHTYFHVEEDERTRFDIRDIALDFYKYVPSPMFLDDFATHGQILDASFVSTLGINYGDTIGTISWLIECYSAERDEEETFYFIWQEAIDSLTSAFGISADQASKIVEGFSLSHQNMEGRELNKPKQEYRAYKRAFFKHKLNGEDAAFFSLRMARECLNKLVSDIPFRKLPSEWESKSVNSSLDKLSLMAGRWFEGVVVENLKTLGIRGSHSVKSLKTSPNERILIPNDVGEIDFLGFHEEQKLIVIIEVKQVGLATEPRLFLDDLSKFVHGTNNYSSKFMKKYNWIIQNSASVQMHFKHTFGLDTKLESAGYTMITLYPSVVTTKIHEFTCVSITKFMNESKKGESWPFSKAPLQGLPPLEGKK